MRSGCGNTDPSGHVWPGPLPLGPSAQPAHPTASASPHARGWARRPPGRLPARRRPAPFPRGTEGEARPPAPRREPSAARTPPHPPQRGHGGGGVLTAPPSRRGKGWRGEKPDRHPRPGPAAALRHGLAGCPPRLGKFRRGGEAGKGGGRTDPLGPEARGEGGAARTPFSPPGPEQPRLATGQRDGAREKPPPHSRPSSSPPATRGRGRPGSEQ